MSLHVYTTFEYHFCFTENFMTLNKASLFQLTQNSQFNTKVSVCVCLADLFVLGEGGIWLLY